MNKMDFEVSGVNNYHDFQPCQSQDIRRLEGLSTFNMNMNETDFAIDLYWLNVNYSEKSD